MFSYQALVRKNIKKTIIKLYYFFAAFLNSFFILALSVNQAEATWNFFFNF